MVVSKCRATSMLSCATEHERRYMTRTPCHGATALLCSLLVLAVTPTQRTIAQELVLEEVIVTAQKRAENVQAIPVTINVMPGDEIENFRIRNIVDLAGFMPGLAILPTPQNLANITIRGLGTGAGNETYDQSVGLFIDGIYAGRQREFQASLFDVERIEIIKGTQNSLLGKNTSLGAISVVSRRPDNELSGYIQADYELEYDSFYSTGAVDVPAGPGAFRLAFNQVAEQGYVRNTFTGNKVPEREQATIRLTGLFPIGYDGELTVAYQYDDLEIHGDTFQVAADQNGLIAALDPGVRSGLNLKKQAFTSFGKQGESRDKQSGERAYINYEDTFASHTLTALTGLSNYDNQRVIDSDFTTGDYLSIMVDQDFSQFTQELRLASADTGRFTYIGGLFYLDSNFDLDETLDAAFPPPFTLGPLPLTGSRLKSYRQDTRVVSVFGQGTLELGDSLRATLGLRWTDEEKDAVFANTHLRSSVGIGIISPEVAPTSLDRDEDNLDGSINLRWDFSDTGMLYTSWARGSKSGGFSSAVSLPQDAEYDTEVADTTEAGVKLQLLGGAAILNLAFFKTEIDDFQVVRFTGLGFETTTIPAESKGLELESQWVASTDLTLAASVTYTDATEKNTGDAMPGSPDWSGNIAARYERALGPGELRWRLDGALNYVDERYTDRKEKFLIDAAVFFELRLALLPANDEWEVALLGRNLLDEEVSFEFDYPIFGGDDETTTVAGLNRPRTIALQGRYNF
jgi:iron complex outermembrane receptor protein